MLADELYNAGDDEIQSDLATTRDWLVRYNASLGMATGERRTLLAERLGAAGVGSTIRPPFHCDYGFNIRLGAGVFLNFGCVILDVVEVSIGAGSVVTRDVPPGATVVGNPARVRGASNAA